MGYVQKWSCPGHISNGVWLSGFSCGTASEMGVNFLYHSESRIPSLKSEKENSTDRPKEPQENSTDCPKEPQENSMDRPKEHQENSTDRPKVQWENSTRVWQYTGGVTCEYDYKCGSVLWWWWGVIY